MNFETALEQELERIAVQPDAFTLQIGAGDGLAGDLLRPFLNQACGPALLLEPIPHVYESLCRNYAHRRNVVCRQLAIGECDGTSIMYRIGDLTGLPWWADQLASFHLAVILAHQSLIPDIADRIVAESVPCMRMQTLLVELPPVTVLAIDTEGQDAAIVMDTLNCGVYPRLILFEHKHLVPDIHRRLVIQLEGLGYGVLAGASDTLGFRDSGAASTSGHFPSGQ